MTKRLKIGVDIDGVLVNFASAFIKEAEQVLGRKIEGVQTTWDFDCLGLSHGEITRVWDIIKATQDWFLLKPRPFPGVAEALSDLCVKHEVYFITSRASTAGFTAQEQSQRYIQGLGVEFPTVIANKDKGLVAAALELDYFIDDFPGNISLIMAKSPKTKVYMRDTSYNVEERHLTPYHAASFEDFVEKIENE